jgi:hypothetical protein
MWFNYTTYDLMFNGTNRSVEVTDSDFDSWGEPHCRECAIGDFYLTVNVGFEGEGSSATIEDPRGDFVYCGSYPYTDIRRAFLEVLNAAHRLLDSRFLIAVEMTLPQRDHEQLTLT